MNFFSRMSLHNKMSILALASLVLVAGLFALVALQAIQESTRRDMEDRLITAQVVSAYIDQVLERNIQIMENVHEDFDARLNDSQSLVEESDILQEVYSHLEPSVSRVSLQDRNGKVLAVYPEASAPPQEDFNRIQSVFRSGQPSIAMIDASQSGQSATVSIMIPLTGQNGQSHGLLNALIDLSSPDLLGFLQPIKLGTTGYAQIVDQEGRVVATTNRDGPPEQTIHPDRFAALIRAAGPTVVTCHRCHSPEDSAPRNDDAAPKEKDLLAFAPISSAPWGVAIRQSEEEVFAPTRGLQSRMMIYGLISLALILVLVWVATNNILRPITSLTEAARRIGRGDLSGMVASSTHDEIGDLARAFNTMTTDLRRSRTEIETTNQLLMEETEILSAMLKVAEEIGRATDTDELLATLVQIVPRLVVCQRCYTLLWQKDTDVFVPTHAWGVPDAFVSSLLELRISPDITPLFQEAIIRKAPVHSSIGESYPGIPQDFKTMFGTTSMLVTPLISKEHLLGAIALDYTAGSHEITAKDIAILQGVASQVSLAMENAELFVEASKAEAYRELSQLKSEFVARASHELRTPLTSIKGFSETLLRADIAIPEDVRQEFLGSINNMSDHMISLINSLLNLSRIEEGTLELNIGLVALLPLVQGAVERFRTPNSLHTFRIYLSPTSISVMSDADRLDDVLTNLISNAVRYSPNGGEITVRAGVVDDAAVISVTDKGIGIPPDKLDDIFRRFQRVNNIVSRQVGGAGLGLSISKGYVEALGGRIWVESAEGKGSTFSFTVPLAFEQDPQAAFQQSAQV